MILSLFLSIVSTLIAVLAFYVGYLTRKADLINYIENQLTIRANECNKYIIKEGLGPPNQTETISAVLTNIIYAERILDLNYKNHARLLFYYDRHDFIQFFYIQVHTSIIELIKKDLQKNIDLFNDLSTQHLACQRFLKPIIDIDPSKPKFLS